ncbi:hypothetical protein HK405_006747 [Cladochytrium tenue]|nr:hypothetical protein HK405_006747 [Cladochytrium tenue]
MPPKNSGPIGAIPVPRPPGMNASRSAEGAYGGGGGGGGASSNGAPQLGGLFAGGMPKLRPAGSRDAPSTNTGPPRPPMLPKKPASEVGASFGNSNNSSSHSSPGQPALPFRGPSALAARSPPTPSAPPLAPPRVVPPPAPPRVVAPPAPPQQRSFSATTPAAGPPPPTPPRRVPPSQIGAASPASLAPPPPARPPYLAPSSSSSGPGFPRPTPPSSTRSSSYGGTPSPTAAGGGRTSVSDGRWTFRTDLPPVRRFPSGEPILTGGGGPPAPPRSRPPPPPPPRSKALHCQIPPDIIDAIQQAIASSLILQLPSERTIDDQKYERSGSGSSGGSGLRLRLCECLGKGASGAVFRARNEVSGELVAVKQIRKASGLAPAEIDAVMVRLMEIALLKRLSVRDVILCMTLVG